MKCYHGTTAKGLKAMLKGIKSKHTNPWSVSDNDGLMYVWPEDKLINGYDYEEESQFIYQAFESAQIQALVTQEEMLYCVVLEIGDEILQDDYSCENMDSIASTIYISEFDTNMIVKIYECKQNKWHFPIILKGLLKNEYFNKYSIEESLLQVAEALPDDLYLDETREFYYTEYSF